MYTDSNKEVNNPFFKDERPEYLRTTNADNINNVNSLQQINNNSNIGNANSINSQSIVSNPFMIEEPKPEFLQDKSKIKDKESNNPNNSNIGNANGINSQSIVSNPFLMENQKPEFLQDKSKIKKEVSNTTNNQNAIKNPFLVEEPKPEFLQDTNANSMDKVDTILNTNKNEQNIKTGDAEKINSVNTILGIKNKHTLSNSNNQENIFLSNDKGSQINFIANMVNNTGEMSNISNSTQSNGSIYEEQQNVLNAKGFVGLLREEGIEVHNDVTSFAENIKFNDTSITDLNVEEDYNNLNVEKYKQDEKVKRNLEINENMKEKKTISISAELKLIFMIVAGLFLFIMIMPYIDEFLFG